jgi:hypothetical protein
LTGNISPFSSANGHIGGRLVETVQLQLPLRDLLRAQRVSQLWKVTTDHSLTLQRILFFHLVSDTVQEPELNPLLREVFPSLFRVSRQVWRRPGRCDDHFGISDGVIRDSLQGKQLQEQGATMELLWEVVRHMLDKPNSCFFVHWHSSPRHTTQWL